MTIWGTTRDVNQVKKWQPEISSTLYLCGRTLGDPHTLRPRSPRSQKETAMNKLSPLVPHRAPEKIKVLRVIPPKFALDWRWLKPDGAPIYWTSVHNNRSANGWIG